VIVVRSRTPADDEQLAVLLEEMQRHYGVPRLDRTTILHDLTNLPESVEILVAQTDGIVGFATFSTIYPGPGLKGGFFLKELFVSKSARGCGIGKILMRTLARMALDRGLTRIDWTADRNNRCLLAYYDGTGAVREDDKVFYRLKGEALKRFVIEPGT
jgi:GNAT superfamily N-acetyltransferase